MALTSALAAFAPILCAAEIECTDAVELQRASTTYADLLTRYDPPPIAQELLDLLAATQELKVRLNACQSPSDIPDRQTCDALATQYLGMQAKRDAVLRRLSLAMGMQEYLLTLKLKLERPRCEQ